MSQWVVVTLLGVLFCCSSGKKLQSSSQRFSSNIITAEDIEKYFGTGGSRTAYEVIKGLQPNFLNARGCRSFGIRTEAEPAVFLNGTRMTGSNKLHRVIASDIAKVEYSSRLEAQTTHGMNHPCGALFITTKSI